MGTPIERYRKTLEIAVKYDAVPMMLETLVRVAEFLAEQGECERAVQIDLLVLCYPLRDALRQRAENLFLKLEVRLSPRIIQHARDRLDSITLDDMVETILFP